MAELADAVAGGVRENDRERLLDGARACSSPDRQDVVERTRRRGRAGVELRAAALKHQLAGLVRLKGLPVDAIGGECIEDVGDRADAALDRDLVAGRPVG